MLKSLILLLLGTVILLAVACGSGSSSSTDNRSSSSTIPDNSGQNNALATSKPSSITKAAVKEESKPSSIVKQAVKEEVVTNQVDWVTLTDMDKIFSVTVPSSWTASVDDDLRSLEFFLPFYNQGILPLFFGIDENSGSSLFILADFQALLTEEPLPIDANTYADFQRRDLEIQPNYQGGMSSSKITVDGIQTTELRYEASEGVKGIGYVMTSNEPRMGCGSLGVLLIATIAPDSDATIIEKALGSVKILPTAAFTPDCNDRKALSAIDLFPNITPNSAAGAQNEFIEVDGLRLLEWEAYEDEIGFLVIGGVIENISGDLKEMVYVTFDVYDKNGYSLEQVTAFAERLQPERKWKFEAEGFVSAGEVGEIELFDMGTY